MTQSQPNLVELSKTLEQRVRRSMARAKTIMDRYEDSPDLSGHIGELETALPLTIEIAVNAESKSKVQKRKAALLVQLVEDAIEDLNGVLSAYFRSKAQVDEVDDEEPDDEIDIDAIFGEPVEGLDPAARDRISCAVKSALRRKNHRRKNPKGVKVKRVPPYEKVDVSEIASLIGEDALARELSVEHPKPMFADLDRDEDTGVVRRKRVFTETPNVDAKAALEEFGRFVEEEDRRYVKEGKYIKKFPRKTVFSTVENLERLIGVYTANKLAAERKLGLLTHALEEANEKLKKCNIYDLVNALDPEFDNLREKFEKAFEGRKF